MNIRYSNIVLTAFTALLVFGGCSTPKQVKQAEGNRAALYNPSEFSLNADYKVYHLNDEMSSLYIRVFPGELLFNQANPENEYRALVEIKYKLFELNDQGIIVGAVDSSTIDMKLLAKDQERSAFFASKVLLIDSGKEYLLRLEAKDLNRGTVGLRHVFVDKDDIYSAQNFSIISATHGYPKFLSYFIPGEVFRISYREFGVDTMYLDIYRDTVDVPRPAVTMDSPSAFKPAIDTSIVLDYRDSMVFTLPDKGMYHFRVDSTHSEGVTLHNFGSEYPQVKSAESLMEPLFYIATAAEYNALRRSDNLKLAVDNFWLRRNPAAERSRELIRIYYNRVLYSNLYFASDKEGWKTDRGMIFILFGPPDRMKDTGAEQRWYYISRRQGKVVEFVFDRRPSLYTNQDLIWRKSYETMQYWSSAVSTWRSGKVYSINR